MKVKIDHRSKFSNLSNWKEEATSFHCTGRYELNKLTSLPMSGFTAQLVEHLTGITEVTGSIPVFQASSFQLLKLENLLR